jgi:hypothetical protein
MISIICSDVTKIYHAERSIYLGPEVGVDEVYLGPEVGVDECFIWLFELIIEVQLFVIVDIVGYFV